MKFQDLYKAKTVCSNVVSKAQQSHYTPCWPSGERIYSSYSFLTSVLDWGEWSASRPGRALPRGTNVVSITGKREMALMSATVCHIINIEPRHNFRFPPDKNDPHAHTLRSSHVLKLRSARVHNHVPSSIFYSGLKFRTDVISSQNINGIHVQVY
jgi:hypothetical protein